MNDELQRNILTGVISFAVGYLLKNIEPSARLIWWSTHAFHYNLPNPPNPNVGIYTRSITIQNIGRKIAENIEVTHQSPAGFFKLEPAYNYTTAQTPTGEHIINVPSLAPKNFFTVEFISFQPMPALLYVKSKEGMAQWVKIQPQRIWPRWYVITLQALILVGLAFSVYWLIRAFNAINALF